MAKSYEAWEKPISYWKREKERLKIKMDEIQRKIDILAKGKKVMRPASDVSEYFLGEKNKLIAFGDRGMVLKTWFF